VCVCVCVQVVGDGYSTYYYMNGRPTDDLPGIAEFLKTFHSWKLVGECVGTVRRRPLPPLVSDVCCFGGSSSLAYC